MNGHKIRAMLSSKRTEMGASRQHRYDGIVYLVWFPKLEMHKIGHTRDMAERRKDLRQIYGEHPEVVHTIQSNWPYAAEQILIAGCELEPVIGREAGHLGPNAIDEIKRMLGIQIESTGRNGFAVWTEWRE